jgi:hypothetical protein
MRKALSGMIDGFFTKDRRIALPRDADADADLIFDAA